MFEISILLTGIAVFFARVLDVSIGTVRTIVTVQGRTAIAFILAVVETAIWILVVSAVINQVKQAPILVIFYSVGFATGNVMGIWVEKKLAFGLIVFKVITRDKSNVLAMRFRQMGQPVTVFTGEGLSGPVYELYVVCRRRDLRKFIPITRELDPKAFYITEQARDVSKVLRPIYQPITGWRSKMKRK
jgi:uncharacterized protein YebE (UPF0316 family)